MKRNNPVFVTPKALGIFSFWIHRRRRESQYPYIQGLKKYMPQGIYWTQIKTGVTREGPSRQNSGDAGKHLDIKVKISISDVLVPKTPLCIAFRVERIKTSVA